MTSTRLKVLRYVTVYCREHGYPPTEAEIAGTIGIDDSTAHYHLVLLERDEMITKKERSPRSAWPTQLGWSMAL